MRSAPARRALSLPGPPRSQVRLGPFAAARAVPPTQPPRGWQARLVAYLGLCHGPPSVSRRSGGCRLRLSRRRRRQAGAPCSHVPPLTRRRSARPRRQVGPLVLAAVNRSSVLKHHTFGEARGSLNGGRARPLMRGRSRRVSSTITTDWSSLLLGSTAVPLTRLSWKGDWQAPWARRLFARLMVAGRSALTGPGPSLLPLCCATARPSRREGPSPKKGKTIRYLTAGTWLRRRGIRSHRMPRRASLHADGARGTSHRSATSLSSVPAFV